MTPSTASTLSLADLKSGEHASLLYVNVEKGVARRLTSLGFTPGVDIQMTQNYGHGPLVVTLRSTRIALGRQEARNTFVEKAFVC